MSPSGPESITVLIRLEQDDVDELHDADLSCHTWDDDDPLLRILIEVRDCTCPTPPGSSLYEEA